MNIEALHIGMKVEHPHYGVGVVKGLSEQIADILFEGGIRSVSPEKSQIISAEPVAAVSNLDIPLAHLIEQTAQAIVKEARSRKAGVPCGATRSPVA